MICGGESEKLEVGYLVCDLGYAVSARSRESNAKTSCDATLYMGFLSGVSEIPWWADRL